MYRALNFAVLAQGQITVSEERRRFATVDTGERKRLFATAVLAHVPLVRMAHKVLDERRNHRVSGVRFRDELKDHMSPDYADDTLRVVIAWRRYAELFSYDGEAGQFSLEEVG